MWPQILDGCKWCSVFAGWWTSNCVSSTGLKWCWCQTISLCWLDIRGEKIKNGWYRGGWQIRCFFQMFTENPLYDLINKLFPTKNLSGLIVVVLSLSFVTLYSVSLEFWLPIWQKSNKKQNEVSLKTFDRLWDLTMCQENKQTKKQIDWWRKSELTAIWITAERC